MQVIQVFSVEQMQVRQVVNAHRAQLTRVLITVVKDPHYTLFSDCDGRHFKNESSLLGGVSVH